MNDTRVLEYDQLICVTWRLRLNSKISAGTVAEAADLVRSPLRSRSAVPPLTLRSAPPEFWPAPLRFPLCSRSAHMFCPLAWLDGRTDKPPRQKSPYNSMRTGSVGSGASTVGSGVVQYGSGAVNSHTPDFALYMLLDFTLYIFTLHKLVHFPCCTSPSSVSL